MTALRYILFFSYSFIILIGWMSGVPFILWLVFTIFDFGNIDQIFAILAAIGTSLNFIKSKNNPAVILLSFAFMLSPLISRMIQVPIEAFDYLAFQMPLGIYIVTHLILFIIK
ncbi:hypothetical protein [Moheibacter sediminis]|uniref:Uncharacterized protein n=1 Tax=Moheibacter sediminis TaxID=1434700 RepID=A0A1W2ASP5_9FLAO|nr:hypothetical protein [Moheibacter sediminis]SMC63726.1 hypothetical protein SAMN06296427_10550 [Moheibacter sediminis]